MKILLKYLDIIIFLSAVLVFAFGRSLLLFLVVTSQTILNGKQTVLIPISLDFFIIKITEVTGFVLLVSAIVIAVIRNFRKKTETDF